MIHTIQMKFRGGHTSKTEVVNLVSDVVNLIMLSKIHWYSTVKKQLKCNVSYLLYVSNMAPIFGWRLFQFLLGKISMSKNNHQV